MKKRSKAYDQYRKLFDRGSYLEAAHFAELEYLNGDQNNSFWLTRQAAALSRSGDHQQAFGKAKQALSIQPENPYAVLALADALSGLGKTKEALSYYEEIAADTKVSAYAHKSIFDCLTVLKDWDRILQLLDQWEMPPDKSFRWRVNALAGQNRLDEAIEICHRWLRKSPGNRQGLWTLTELEIQRDGMDSVLSRMGKLAKMPQSRKTGTGVETIHRTEPVRIGPEDLPAAGICPGKIRKRIGSDSDHGRIIEIEPQGPLYSQRLHPGLQASATTGQGTSILRKIARSKPGRKTPVWSDSKNKKPNPDKPELTIKY
jgi:tetratricopeptide (TPR) repeat protein